MAGVTKVGANFTTTKAYLQLEKLKQDPLDLTQKEASSYDRFSQWKATSASWDMYFACERIDEEVFSALQAVASELNLIGRMRKIQSGEIVNMIHGYESENRAVLHTALRDIFQDQGLTPDKERAHVMEEIQKLERFEKEMESFNYLLCIGIGGSELGPKALYTALEAYSKKGKQVYFISNVDPDNLVAAVTGIDLRKTLVVIISKTGTTLETAKNESLVRSYFQKAGLDCKNHFVSVSQKGSPLDNTAIYRACFYIWPWVGGRFSASSSIGGLIFTFAFGFTTYKEFLEGAHKMDKAALDADVYKNLPLLGALLNLWNHNFLGSATLAIIPYSYALRYWAAHIQQVEMESNGKSIDQEGEEVAYKTCPVFWGEPGTNAQHSFFQMIHQGTEIVPIEFIGCKEPQRQQSDLQSQEMLLSNLVAQAIALAFGSTNANPNKRFPGNRPSHILFSEKLTPESLGALFAYYEHKVAFEGMLYGINSFDQPGVELGKALANRFLTLFEEEKAGEKSEFTSGAEKFFFELIHDTSHTS